MTEVDTRWPIEVSAGLQFATALVNYNEGHGPLRERPLLLDAYLPAAAPAPLPALVMAFGGAFHRGARHDDVRPEGEARNTNIAEYCRRFAARGYACFSIDYRLTQEDPHPGSTPALGPEPVPTGRVDEVRKLLGLPPATSAMVRRAQEAAIDDMASAYRYVAGNARRFGVDANRVAVGGFSAGGRMAVTAALAEDIAPAAVVSLSGVTAASVVDGFHASGQTQMPVFLAHGEHDLRYINLGAVSLLERLQAADHPYLSCRLPGQTHFYPAEAQVESSRGSFASLEAAMAAFLECYLRPGLTPRGPVPRVSGRGL